MTWFQNMKIASKLICGFLCVAVIAAIVGLVGVLNLYRLVQEDTMLYEYYTVPLEQINAISTAYQKTRVIARDAMVEKDPRNLPGYMTKADAQLKIMKEQLAKFSSTLVSEEGRKSVQRLETAIGNYEPYLKKAFGLMQAGQSAQAYQMAQTEGMKIAADIDETVDVLQGMKIQMAKDKAEQNQETANKAIITMLVFVAVGVSLAVGLGIFVARAISRPVVELVEVAGKIAGGDLNVDIAVKSRDEVGRLGRAFGAMAHNINLALTNIDEAAEQVAAGAHQVAAAGQALSQGSTEQASSIEEITASMTQVASQTKNNAVNANQANELALAAKEQAGDGNMQMQAMVKAMAEINDASGNISKIIKVIDEIAFQTNILALNAAVEAARAGQHGKGFAVVAEEVRNLAARSANAAKETTTMIEGSIKKVEIGTKIANETAAALDSIVDQVTKATALVGDIAAASNEQATAIAQINQAIGQVSQVVQTNSATAEESASASEELSGQAEVMKENVRKFSLKPVDRVVKPAGMWSEDAGRIAGAVPERTRRQPGREEGARYEPALTPAKKILLDDREFGKY